MPLLTRKAVEWIEAPFGERPFFPLFSLQSRCIGLLHLSSATKGTSGVGPHGDWIHEPDRSVGEVLR